MQFLSESYFFQKNGINNSEIWMKPQKVPKSQSNLAKKKQTNKKKKTKNKQTNLEAPHFHFLNYITKLPQSKEYAIGIKTDTRLFYLWQFCSIES